MPTYIIRRILGMVPTLLLASVVTFAIIQLPPGDFATSYIANLAQQGDTSSMDALENLRETYGLNQPLYTQYTKWMGGILSRGDFGISFEYREPVSSLSWESTWW